MLMAPAGWAIERAMAAVPPSRSADRRAIVPQRLADDIGGSRPPTWLPPRAGLTRITAAITRRFIVHLPVKLKRSLRDNESGGTATPVEAAVAAAAVAAAAAAAVGAARVAPSAASCWRHSVWNC